MASQNINNSIIPQIEYEVESILDYRNVPIVDPRTNNYKIIKEYLIKWLGYEEQTWEPESNLEHCQTLLKKFKKKMKSENAKKGRMAKKAKKIDITPNEFHTNNELLEAKNSYKSSIKKPSILKNPKSCLKVSKFNSFSRVRKNKALEKSHSFNIPTTIKKYKNSKEEEFTNSRTIITEFKYNNEFFKMTKFENIQEKENILFKSEKIKNYFPKVPKNSPISTDFKNFKKLVPSFLDVMNAKNEKNLINENREINALGNSPSYSTINEDNKFEERKITDANMEQCIIDNNKYLEDINKNKNIEFSSICEIRIPHNYNDSISILGKFKVDDKYELINGKSDSKIFPQNEVMKYYENIMKTSLKGKKLVFTRNIYENS